MDEIDVKNFVDASAELCEEFDVHYITNEHFELFMICQNAVNESKESEKRKLFPSKFESFEISEQLFIKEGPAGMYRILKDKINAFFVSCRSLHRDKKNKLFEDLYKYYFEHVKHSISDSPLDSNTLLLHLGGYQTPACTFKVSGKIMVVREEHDLSKVEQKYTINLKQSCNRTLQFPFARFFPNPKCVAICCTPISFVPAEVAKKTFYSCSVLEGHVILFQEMSRDVCVYKKYVVPGAIMKEIPESFFYILPHHWLAALLRKIGIISSLINFDEMTVYTNVKGVYIFECYFQQISYVDYIVDQLYGKLIEHITHEIGNGLKRKTLSSQSNSNEDITYEKSQKKEIVDRDLMCA